MASKDLLKSESDLQTPAVSKAPRRFTSMNKLYLFFVVAGLSVFELWYHGVPARLTTGTPLIEHDKTGSAGQLVRSYNLQIGQRWMNQGSEIFNFRYLSDRTDKPSRWRSMAFNARMQRRDAVSNIVRRRRRYCGIACPE